MDANGKSVVCSVDGCSGVGSVAVVLLLIVMLGGAWIENRIVVGSCFENHAYTQLIIIHTV